MAQLIFETDEALVAYIRENLTINLAREWEKYGNGYSAVTATVSFFEHEVGQDSMGVEPEIQYIDREGE